MIRWPGFLPLHPIPAQMRFTSGVPELPGFRKRLATRLCEDDGTAEIRTIIPFAEPDTILDNSNTAEPDQRSSGKRHHRRGRDGKLRFRQGRESMPAWLAYERRIAATSQ
jgi:hypothetical protein